VPGAKIGVVIGYVSPGAGKRLAADVAMQFKVVAPGRDGADLEKLVRESPPHVVLLGEDAGRALMLRLASTASVNGVAVLVNAPTQLYAEFLSAAGISCIALGASEFEIRSAIHDIADRRCVFVPEDRTAALQRQLRLTPRETEVLGYLRQGMRYAKIALEMSIGIETVRTHAARVRRKLGVQTSRELSQGPDGDVAKK
jgi:DNA-binding NarL/FixJ family response regulator